MGNFSGLSLARNHSGYNVIVMVIVVLVIAGTYGCKNGGKHGCKNDAKMDVKMDVHICKNGCWFSPNMIDMLAMAIVDASQSPNTACAF